jgi:IS5 family transposase
LSQRGGELIFINPRSAIIQTVLEDHLGRCYLKGCAGDAANVILSAIGHNFRRILAWLRELFGLFLALLRRMLASSVQLNPAS